MEINHSKINAVVISGDEDFLKRLTRRLKAHQFKVFSYSSQTEWEISPPREKVDLFVIDNHSNASMLTDFMESIRTSHPNSLVLNFGDSVKIKPDSNLIFNIDSDQDSLNLEPFLSNISQLLKREKYRLELVAMLIHDVRSPMNSMNGYLELLLNETFGLLNDGQKNLIEKAMILGDQSLDMLEDINEIYQSEEFIFRMQKEPFPFPRILDDALIHIWIQADRKNIKIKKNVAEKLPFVLGDPFHIQRVLVNLAGNAVKYCPEESKIQIDAVPESETTLLVSVADSGGGIPDDQIDKIFDKYYRISKSQQFRKGYGLGLHICKTIIESHGGKIWAENNEQGGVTFKFTLPFSFPKKQ